MFQMFALKISCQFRPATCKCLEILKTSSEQGGLKGRAGDFPEGRGRAHPWRQYTWSSCKSEKRLSPPSLPFPEVSDT